MNRCPKCNASIDEDDKYCIFCGTKIYEYTQKETIDNSGDVKCKSCGSIIKAGQKFCMECGAKREDETTSEGDSYIFGKTYVKDSRAYLFKDHIFKTIPEYFKNAFKFSGRACRSEFWFPYLMINLIGIPIVCTIIETIFTSFVYTLSYPEFGLNYSFNLISIIFSLLMLIPEISCMIRRIRDTGRKPSAFFYWFVPFIGGFILIYILASRTDSYNEPSV